MAESKEYVKLWLSYEDYFREYDDESIGTIVRAMLAYRKAREQPQFDGPERFIWPAIQRDIDESIKAQETAAGTYRENGKKGGRPPKAVGFSETKENQKNQSGFSKTKKTYGQGQGQGQGHSQGHIPPKSPSEGDAFERFWSVYPRKVGKQSAKRAFERVKVPLETLVTAVERQKCSDQWTRDNGQYIPHPTTWLNQGRWDDVLPGNDGGCRRNGSFAGGDVFAEMLEEEKNRGKS